MALGSSATPESPINNLAAQLADRHAVAEISAFFVALILTGFGNEQHDGIIIREFFRAAISIWRRRGIAGFEYQFFEIALMYYFMLPAGKVRIKLLEPSGSGLITKLQTHTAL